MAVARRNRSATLAVALLAAAAWRIAPWARGFVSFAGLSSPSRGAGSHGGRADVRPKPTALLARGGEERPAATLEAGDKCKARSPDDEMWYPAKIEKDNGDGTFAVRWDDPDGGEEVQDVGAEFIKKVIIFKDYKVGDDCKAMSPDDEQWYPGSIAAINKDGTFKVKWDDPDGGAETADCNPETMRRIIFVKSYKKDDRVEAKFPDDGLMYPGVVTKDNKDGTFAVKWDDPDGGPEESPVSYKDMMYPPIPLDQLEVGQKYTGTVTGVKDFGAFVNFGAVTNGMVHVSAIAEERVDDIYAHVEEGDEVEVWVSKIRDGRIGLTMVESKIGAGGRPQVNWEPFQAASPDDWQEGVVARLAPFGAFITVTLESGEKADGLAHITQIRDGFVENMEDELSEGQEVKVRITRVDAEAGKMSLSLKESGGGDAPRQPRGDVSLFKDVAPDQWLTGTVVKVASFGAFVRVAAPEGEGEGQGMVHVTQIRDGYVESVADELQEGQEVQVRVVSVDLDGGKMSLSMKPEEGADGGEEEE